jgi:hypothetical protein
MALRVRNPTPFAWATNDVGKFTSRILACFSFFSFLFFLGEVRMTAELPKLAIAAN